MQALLEILTPGSAEWLLARALDPSRVPNHIAVIMDGNGRWANHRSLPRVAGHKAGVEPVRSTVDTCARLGVRCLTLYAFSIENWKRPRGEVDTLWRLLRYYLRREIPELKKSRVRFRAIGRIEGLPGEIRAELAAAEERTAECDGLQLNLAINYSGRAEIADAVNRLIAEARAAGTLDRLELDETAIASRLYTAGQPEPDLLIRTSGEMRISNFLLWQIAYAELFVTDTLWPDFDRKALLEAIVEYQKRDRRFGGISGSPRTSQSGETILEPAGVSLR
jgi:undecaprenyl diphosphate synthase